MDLALTSLHNPFLEGEVNAYRNLVEDVFEEWKKEAEVQKDLTKKQNEYSLVQAK